MGVNSCLFVAVICLLYTSGQGTLPRGGNKSALPYLLREGGKDACLRDNSTLKGKAECLQGLLENYYGRYFTVSCPSLPLVLAEYECEGCPWDRVNVSMVNPAVAGELKRSELFHPANCSCSIANHAEPYNDFAYIWRYVFGYGILGTLLLFLVSTYYSVSSSNETVNENGSTIFGIKMPEPLFLLTLWISYHGGSFLLIVSEDYSEICGDLADSIFQEAARYLFYVVLLMISVKRCRALRLAGLDDGAQSWERYFASTGQWKTKRLLSFLLGPPAIIFYLLELINFDNGENSYYDKSVCFVAAKNWQYFAIQLGSVLLELFVVVVYTCGPSRERSWFYFRYALLVWSVSVGSVLFGLVQKGHSGFESTFMMIPRVADAKIASPRANLVHAVCVSLMGLLEPIRIGWPGGDKDERKA